MNEEMLILASYINISSYRLRVIKSLSKRNVMTPTEIAKDSGIRTNHISKVLKELKNKGVVECINESARKGKLYRLTTLGWDILKFL